MESVDDTGTCGAIGCDVPTGLTFSRNGFSGPPELRHRLLRRGGARRVPVAASDGLKEHTCRQLLRAVERAAEIGKPMNYKFDISWEHGGVAEKEVTAATRTFIKKAGDWVRPHDGQLCWIYVHERGKILGTHVHMLLHLKHELAPFFRQAARRWVVSLLPGKRYVAATLKSDCIKGSKAPDGVCEDLYQHSLRRRLHYMLKEADAALDEKLGLANPEYIGAKWGGRSIVYGMRAGRWQERSRPVARNNVASSRRRAETDLT